MKATLTFLLLALAIGLSAQQRFREMERPARHASRGTHGALAAGSDYAVDAGMRMFYQGGNAVDAGVAATFAAATSEFSHIGFGGEAPYPYSHARRQGSCHCRRWHDAQAGDRGVLPRAPLATRRAYFRSRKGRVEGHGAGGRSHARARSRHGRSRAGGATRVRNEVIWRSNRPGRRVWPMVSPSTRRARAPSSATPDSSICGRLRCTFSCPDDRVTMPGEIFRQPDLARTLRSMAEVEKKALATGASRAAALDAVRDYFYRGDIARRIDAFSRQNQGLLALRRHGGVPSLAGRPRRPPRFTAIRSTSPASGARGLHCSRR